MNFEQALHKISDDYKTAYTDNPNCKILSVEVFEISKNNHNLMAIVTVSHSDFITCSFDRAKDTTMEKLETLFFCLLVTGRSINEALSAPTTALPFNRLKTAGMVG